MKLFRFITERRHRKMLLWFFRNYPDQYEALKKLYAADINGYKKTCKAIVYEFKRKEKDGADFGSYIFHYTRNSRHFRIKEGSRYVFVEKKRPSIARPKNSHLMSDELFKKIASS